MSRGSVLWDRVLDLGGAAVVGEMLTEQGSALASLGLDSSFRAFVRDNLFNMKIAGPWIREDGRQGSLDEAWTQPPGAPAGGTNQRVRSWRRTNVGSAGYSVCVIQTGGGARCGWQIVDGWAGWSEGVYFGPEQLSSSIEYVANPISASLVDTMALCDRILVEKGWLLIDKQSARPCDACGGYGYAPPLRVAYCDACRGHGSALSSG